MSLKFYTLLTLIFMLVLGLFIHFAVSSQSTAIDVLGIHLPPFPMGVWAVIPFFLFYIINVIVMIFSNVQHYFKLKSYEHDFEKLKDAFYNAFLQKEKTYEYKTDRYRLLGDIVASATLEPKKGAIIEDSPKIQSAFHAIQSLKKGDPVDMSRFGLSKNNVWMIKNAHNLLHSDVKSAEDMLSHWENYDDSMLKEAFGTYASTASLSEMLKYKRFISIRGLLTILTRVNADENPIEITLEELLDFSRHVTREINQLGFLELAIAVRKVLMPEDRIRYFELLLEDGYEVNEALLYTLLDLELVDKARELLENFTESDFPKYRAFLALKDMNYTCNIDLLINV
ncbi:MAG: hypothetical protein OEW60_03635 [Thiovulaceae bacterium]|nr:hypothetical protein [Sulfurimonadaceae bacterium]